MHRNQFIQQHIGNQNNRQISTTDSKLSAINKNASQAV